MPVNTRHPDYLEAFDRWQTCNDFTAGASVVKKKREKYLPRPNPEDTSPRALQSYNNYLNRAIFYEYSGDTVAKYIGMAFKKNPTVELHSSLDYLKTNADGAGMSLYQQAQKGLSKLLTNARFGLFVDYPPVDETLTVKQQSQRKIRPKILFYDASSIINWNTTVIDNEVVVSLVVLEERIKESKPDDKYELEVITQWRVLALDDSGFYVEVYRQNNEGKFYLHTDRIYPLNSKGENWSFIPFQIFGSQYNNFGIQKIPIEPLVHIEKGIYQNSADAENSRFYCGQIQAYMSGSDTAFRYYTEPSYDDKGNKIEPPAVKIGSETVLMLGDGGSFGFAQAQPNTMATEGIKEKREILAELGAQMAQIGTVAKTATQSNNETQAQFSKVSLCVANLNEGYYNILTWCNEYMGVTQEPIFEITQQFIRPVVDTSLLQAVDMYVDKKRLPMSAFITVAKDNGLIDPEKTEDDILGEIEAQGTSWIVNESEPT